MIHIPHIKRLKLRNLGWFTIKEALQLTSFNQKIKSKNPVIMGLYAFAVQDERPQNHLWPWEVKSVVDIGKAGGNGESIRADYKRGKHKSPFIKSALYDRICKGRTEYTPGYSENGLNESMIKVRELVSKDDNKLWVCILQYDTPHADLSKVHLMPDVTIELFTCESEAILAYKTLWGVPPLGNPGATAKLKAEKRKQQKKTKSASESYFTQPNILNFT